MIESWQVNFIAIENVSDWVAGIFATFMYDWFFFCVLDLIVGGFVLKDN